MKHRAIPACLAGWLCCTLPALPAAGKAHAVFAPLPPGSTVPVTLDRKLDSRDARPGEVVVAHLSQRIPLGSGAYFPDKGELVGQVVANSGTLLTLQFESLRLESQSEPVSVQLRAAADWLAVEQTEYPIGATDRGTSNPSQWTTRQLGGDEVYLANGTGKVYDRYSQPVGMANGYGVFAYPAFPGAAPRALGPFSTTAKGLFSLPGLSIVSDGSRDGRIVLRVTGSKWQLRAHDALLLQVTGGAAQ